MSRLLDWTDDDGRTWRSQLPDDAPLDADPRYYTPIGPVDTSSLGLPDHIAILLHNELHRRGLLSWRDLRHNRPELDAAIRSALSTTTASIVALYHADWEQGVEEGKAAMQAAQQQAAAVRSTVKGNGSSKPLRHPNETRPTHPTS